MVLIIFKICIDRAF